MEHGLSRRGFIKQAAAGIAAGAALPVAAQAQGPAGTSLYARLGGYDALAAVTDDFIGRLSSDRQLGKFFVGPHELAEPDPPAGRRSVVPGHGRSVRLHRSRHEDRPQGSRHQRVRLAGHRPAPHGDLRQVQGPGARAHRGPGAAREPQGRYRGEALTGAARPARGSGRPVRSSAGGRRRPGSSGPPRTPRGPRSGSTSHRRK